MTGTNDSRSVTLHHKLKGLYAITDERLIPEKKFGQSIEAALKGGSRIIQYRDKSHDREKRLRQANLLRWLCDQYQALFIVNDDIELTEVVNADGIHLGKDDMNLADARQRLGSEAIIGISCYDDIDLARSAEKNSADYVAFGTMFSSPTKPNAICATPDVISMAKQQVSLPVCAIGGITVNNISQLAKHHADMAAVISSLFSAENIEHAARTMNDHFVTR